MQLANTRFGIVEGVIVGGRVVEWVDEPIGGDADKQSEKSTHIQ